MSITIEQLSKHLGISVSTVSKALNGYSDVSEETRQRVDAAAKSLGYHPNLAARSLRRGRTDKIGLLINNPIEFLSDYIGDVMSGAALGAEKCDQNLILYTHEVVSPDELRRICRAREVDGLLLIFDPSKAATEVLTEEQMPYVVFGRRAQSPAASFITPDNFAGAFALTEHLIAQGHTRIGFTTRPTLGIVNDERFAGYKQALAAAGIPFDPTLIVETRSGVRDGAAALAQLLDLPQPPTAMFAFYDLMAADAIRAAHERGLQVPADIAIAGYDGLKVSLRTTPRLTTVRQPLGRMGAQAIEMLVSRIEKPEQPAAQITMPVELIIRESTQIEIEVASLREIESVFL